MQILVRVLLFSTLTMVSACRTGGRPRPPESDLDRAIYLVERDKGQDLHPISNSAVGGVVEQGAGKVESVPWDHPVDTNSRIEVRWDKSMLRPLVGRAEIAPIDTFTTERSERLVKLLDALARMTEVRAATWTRWRALEAAADEGSDVAALENAFAETLEPLTHVKDEVLDLIVELYPDTPQMLAKRKHVDVLYKNMTAKPDEAAAARAFLQAEIDALDRTTRSAVKDVEAGFALRLEAFLMSSGDAKEPVALHLDGYDTIAAKQVMSIDRFGLALSPVERERLLRLLASAKEIADAANKLKAGDAELEDALDGASSDLAKRLDLLVSEAQAVVQEWSSRKANARWEQTVASSRTFLARVKTIAQGRLASTSEALLADAETELEKWVDHSTFVDELLKAIDSVTKLRAALEDGPGDEVLRLSIELSGSLRDVVQELDSLPELLDQARELALTAITEIESAVPTVKAEIDTAYAETLGKEVDEWMGLVTRTRKLLGPVQRFVGFAATATPLGANIRVPEAIDVPLDDAPNTAIDLTRADRKPGDRVELRASLVEGGKVKASTSSSFVVEKLGWHADLVPAVVLVTADQLAGSDDSGGFTASLSWMLRYGPRPYEDSALANVSDWLGWGVGLHATLLNFDPDNDAEIGLGATVGLWGDRLLIGAGVNPLADSDQDGRYYYFVGSSLIPLLQALSD